LPPNPLEGHTPEKEGPTPDAATQLAQFFLSAGGSIRVSAVVFNFSGRNAHAPNRSEPLP